MIHVDLGHPSTSPLKSSASAAALDSFTWDVGGDDPFGPPTSGGSVMGPDDPLGGVDTESTLVHTQEFRPEEFLNDDLEDVINLSPDVDSVGMDPLSVTPAVTPSIQTTQPQPTAPTSNDLSSSSAGDSGPSSHPPATDTALLASPNSGEGDRSSSLSPVPDTNSPSGQGESGHAGDDVKQENVAAPPEQVTREEEEEEEEAIGATKVDISRQSSPLSPLTPPADELEVEGEEASEEKKGGEKKVERKVATTRSAKSQPPQKQQLRAPQCPQQKRSKSRRTTRSPSRTIGTRMTFTNNASTFMQKPQQLRQPPDISTFDPPAQSNNNDPKVTKVLELNSELLK